MLLRNSAKFLFISVLLIHNRSTFAYMPAEGIVKDKNSAIQLAEIFLVNVYGKQILKQRPFVATLNGEIWKVEGSFHCLDKAPCKGGVAEISINKIDGKVLDIQHGR